MRTVHLQVEPEVNLHSIKGFIFIFVGACLPRGLTDPVRRWRQTRSELQTVTLRHKRSRKIVKVDRRSLCGIVKKLTVSNDGIKQSTCPPNRLGRIRHHDVYVHLLCSVLSQVCSDVLIRSSPFLVFTTRPSLKRNPDLVTDQSERR